MKRPLHRAVRGLSLKNNPNLNPCKSKEVTYPRDETIFK